jgi:hypothetical protein
MQKFFAFLDKSKEFAFISLSLKLEGYAGPNLPLAVLPLGIAALPSFIRM